MRGRVLPDNVLIAAELAGFVGGLAAVDVPGFLQFHHGGPDGVLALQADPGKTGEGVVPVSGRLSMSDSRPLALRERVLSRRW